MADMGRLERIEHGQSVLWNRSRPETIRPAIDAENGIARDKNMKINIAKASTRTGSRYPKPFDRSCRGGAPRCSHP